MYHDVTEIITGDLPTPIKYYNREIRSVYEEIEQNATEQLLAYLPEDLRSEYKPLFGKIEEESELWELVKGADKLSALIKCIEERQMGNIDFSSAEAATLEAVHKLNLPEVEVFLKEFIPAYTMTLDEQAE
jgi:5'-deoxynucleotidase